MNYLERNELILQEIGKQLKKRTFQGGQVGKEVGRSSWVKFTSIGSFKSSKLNTLIYVGLKEDIASQELEIRAEAELARIAVIAKYIPILEPALPIFYGHLVQGNGKIAIITEDFSQGGQQEIEQWPYQWAHIPNMSELSEMVNKRGLDSFRLLNNWLFYQEKLTELDPRLKAELYDLTSMCFIAGNKLRLGDFDKFLYKRTVQDVLTEFPIDYNLREFYEYTKKTQLFINDPH